MNLQIKILSPSQPMIFYELIPPRVGAAQELEGLLTTDSRANIARFSFADLLRQSVYSRLAAYEDVNDAERLSQDPR